MGFLHVWLYTVHGFSSVWMRQRRYSYKMVRLKKEVLRSHSHPYIQQMELLIISLNQKLQF